MRRSNLLAVALAASLLTACDSPSPTGSSLASAMAIDQSKVCEVTDWHHDVVKTACTPGQKVVFLPNSWGNEQLPVIFAAVNCDLRFNVAMTVGGVTCVFAPISGDTNSAGEESRATEKEPGKS